MRKHLAAFVVLAALLACSSDSLSPVGPASPEPDPAIVDATGGGREGFYFLQPTVTKPDVAGPFDATLVPRARVCALNASRTECAVILATIPTGSGPNTLTVDPTNGKVTGHWSSPATLELSTVSGSETRYRLEILVDVGALAVTLGYADLWITDKEVDVPAGFVDLVRGKTFVIRFGVLPGTVGYVVVTPNPTEVAIGGTQQMTATAFDLHNVLIASATFAWSSENSDVAAVSSKGLATGLANGSTNILATTRGVTGSAVINVVGDPPVAATAVADEAAAASVPGDAFHTPFNTALNSGGTTPGLLANDVLGSPPADLVSFGGGSLGGGVGDHAAGTTATFGTGGSLQVNGDGSFSFTPSTGFTGLFTFTYRIQNSSGPSEAPVAIAVGVRPAALDDTYPVTIIGNVSINTASSSHFSILANDAGDALTINIGASPNGEAVSNADGTFTFNPSPGFTGTATFSYTVQNGFGPSAAATVSIPVTTPIWFVNASAPAGGDGRIGSPFNCLVDGGAACYDDSANEAGDVLYIAAGTYANSNALVLKATQRVIGQGAAAPSLETLTGLVNAADSPSLPSVGGAFPVMTSAAAGLVLGSSNHLYGFNVGNTVGAGISGVDFGTLTVRAVSFPGPARSGQALGLSNGSIAPASTFTSVSSSGADVGISLADVGGTFVVTGSGSPGTGGTIANTTGSAAIVLSNASMTVSWMVVRDNAGNGVSGTNVAGFGLNQSTLHNNGDDAAEANLRLTGSSGTASITSSTISNASGDNVVVQNTAGTLTFSLSNSTLSNDATETAASNGLLVVGGGTSVINASISNSTFQGHRLAHLRASSSSSAQMVVSVVGNTLECANALATACNATFISNSTGSFAYSILSNVFNGMKAALTLNKSGGTGTMTGSFSNNAIGESLVAGSGGDGLLVLSQVDGGSHTTVITGNAIRNYSLIGIDVAAGNAGILDATVSSNIFEQLSESAQHGIRATAGTTPTSTALMCLGLSGNLLNGAGPADADFRLIQGGLATMRIPFYVGAIDNDAAVVAFVRSLQMLNNEFMPTGIASNTVASGGGGFLGGAACSTPP